MNEENDYLLCTLDDIPDGGARGLLRQGLDDQLCVVRQGQQVFAWLNSCPHERRPLEYRQDQFLSADGKHLTCYAHSAHFDLRTGYCFAGPCTGKSLTPVPIRIEDGKVWIAAKLPSIFE
jgi:nitrite reductase/ring-hydroxylating ferredoxin subunit